MSHYTYFFSLSNSLLGAAFGWISNPEYNFPVVDSLPLFQCTEHPRFPYLVCRMSFAPKGYVTLYPSFPRKI